MIKNEFKNKNVIVAGVGKMPKGSLGSAAKFFSRHGAKVLITDTRQKEKVLPLLKYLRGAKARFHFGGYRMADFKNADIVVKPQGFRAADPYLAAAKSAGAEIVTDMGVFMRLVPPEVPIVAVTGTRGKSTTTALLGEILKRSRRRVYVGGNIGVSPLNFLDELRRKAQAKPVVILELSSWLLEGWKKERIAPTIAVVTNVFPEHLSSYPSYSAYVRAKTEIFAAQDRMGAVVLNRGNAETRKMSKLAKGKVVWFGTKAAPAGVFAKGTAIIYKDKKTERVALLADIKNLPGAHNLENVLAAIAAAKLLGVGNAAIKSTLRSFRGLPNRQELIRVKGGVKFINDTTATSPEGVIAALRTFNEFGKKNIVLITGGTDKKLRFAGMAREVKKTVKDLILFDDTATVKLKRELRRIGYRTDFAPVVRDMKTAVKIASNLASPGDVVILSPGAASFGLFRNEFDRGEQFKKAVRKLCPVEQL